MISLEQWRITIGCFHPSSLKHVVKITWQIENIVSMINEARQADGIEEKVKLLGEAKTAMKEVVEINANNSDTLTLEDRITMLNDDQRAQT